MIASLVALGIGSVVGATPAAAATKGRGAAPTTTSVPTGAPTTTSTSTTSTSTPGIPTSSSTTSTSTVSVPVKPPKTVRHTKGGALGSPTTTSTTVGGGPATTTTVGAEPPTTIGAASPDATTTASTSLEPGPGSSGKKTKGAMAGTGHRPPYAFRAPVRQARAEALAAAAKGLAVAVTAPAGIAADCSTDTSRALGTWLNGLAAGSVWTPPASACYRIDKGVQLRFVAALTIDGGTFEDLNTTAPPQTGHGTNLGRPAFDALGGAQITLENLRIVGAHTGWGYRAALAFQAGIDLQGTVGATITNVSISRTFGDGINLEPLRGGSDYRSGHIANPVENLRVAHVTIKQAGRQGITPASVNGATFSDVSVTGVGFNAWDFESDQRDEGAKNVLVDHCIFSGINITMAGAAVGPITFSNCTMPKTNLGDAVRIRNTSGKPFSGPIVFANDVFRCAASVYVSCFQLGAGSDVTVQDSTVTIGFHRDTIHEAAYSVGNGSHVTFADDVVHGFGHVGTTQAGGTTTVSGGTWTGMSCRSPAVCPAR